MHGSEPNKLTAKNALSRGRRENTQNTDIDRGMFFFEKEEERNYLG
jgi:hypothetical protein